MINLDLDRVKRCGIPEVVFGIGKNDRQLKIICKKLLEKEGIAIVTRIDREYAEKLLKSFDKFRCEYNEIGRVLIIRKSDKKTKKIGRVAIVCAGTSDMPVVEEARSVAEALELEVRVYCDVGVAGLHRLLAAIDKIKKNPPDIIIAVAGMEGALPTVLAGLVDIPVLAVPTSIGYGTGKNGITALNTMLNSCTPIAVFNIDNGYGAAVFAYLICRKA